MRIVLPRVKRHAPALSVGVALGQDGFATIVAFDGAHHNAAKVKQWSCGIGLPGDDSDWGELTTRLQTVKEELGAAAFKLTLTIERPFVQVKHLNLPRLKPDDARQLLERGPDAFFPRIGSAGLVAGVNRVGKDYILAAVTVPSLLAAADRAARKAGFTFIGIQSAGLSAGAGATALAPQLRRGDWHMVIALSSSVEVVHMARGRVVGLRSTPISSATGVSGAAQAALSMLPPTKNRKIQICYAGDPDRVAAIRTTLNAAAFSRADKTIDTMDGRTLAAIGALVDRRYSPTVLTQHRRTVLQRRRRLAGIAAATAAVAVVVLSALGCRAMLAHRLNDVKAARLAIHTDVARALRTNEELHKLGARASAVEALEADRLSIVRLLGSFADALPDDAYIVSLRIDETTLRFDGRARAAAAVVPIFESLPWVASVQLGSAVRRERSGDTNEDHFSVAVRLKALEAN